MTEELLQGQQATRILVHITHGPESPTRAALGFAVAKAALDAGHEVSFFSRETRCN